MRDIPPGVTKLTCARGLARHTPGNRTDSMKRFSTILMHLALLALVCAAAAYWIAKIATPAPTPAPPPVASPPPRDVDPVLAARMFGLVQLANTQVTANVQVSGVFAAGDRSSAVLVVDGKPSRAY